MSLPTELRELPTVPTTLARVPPTGSDRFGELVELVRVVHAFMLPDGTRFNRAPADMRSWEIHATYRLAWHLACFLPSASLAQPLANWLCVAQGELEARGEWRPEALPPKSM